MKKSTQRNLIFLVLILAVGGAVYYFATKAPSQSAVVPSANAGQQQVQCNVIPTYSYSAKDVFSTTLIGGTDQIKMNGDAPTSSLANPTFGARLEYFKTNTTFFVKPEIRDQVFCGANAIQAKAYGNGTVTLKVYDNDNNQFVNATAPNVSIAANGVSNLEVRYQGTAKKSSLPFGGCIAVESPNTITEVTINGAGISTTTPCPHVWTYTVSSTSNTYRTFAIPTGFDADGLGDLKKINLALKAGSSDPVGNMKVTMIAANYYVGNDGNIYLGIEKDKNQDTTKTIAAENSVTVAIY